MPRHCVVKRVVDKRRFARAGNAGHTYEKPDRQLERDALEIISSRPADRQGPAGTDLVAVRRDGDLAMSREILPGKRMRRAADVLGCALRNDLSPVLARAGS